MYSCYNTDIAQFWFEEGENNYKNKWFQSDKDKLHKLDEIITKKFKDKLELCEGYSENKWLHIEKIIDKSSYTNTINQLIDTIICLDQFSRHIYRSSKNKEKIRNNTKKASIFSRFLLVLLKNNLSYSELADIKEEIIIFILMPLKHEDIYNNFKLIHNFLESIYGNAPYFPELITKFYLDSMKKFYTHYKQTNNLISFNYDTDKKGFKLDELESVCEYFPYKQDFDIKININEKLYKITENFLSNLLDSKYNFIEKKIVVSLSGGPDSMVILFILSKLVKRYNISLEAIHINYNNRKENNIEEEFVRYYCQNLKVNLYVFKFEYIQRGHFPREYYENLTRIVRFNMYKSLNAYVILGHIKDDLIENIWSNISKGKDIFKLHKIDECSTIENQVILRPFSRVDKKTIFEFAHKVGIPYLKNTTPVWSNRGKLRNEFIPAVNKQFGVIDDKLLYLSDTINAYHKILEKCIFEPFFKSIIYHRFGLRVNINEFTTMPCHFWQESFIKIFHSLSIKVPTKRSINNFYECIERGKKGIINLSKTHIAYIDMKNNLHILNCNITKQFMRKDNLDYNDWQYLIININTNI